MDDNKNNSSNNIYIYVYGINTVLFCWFFRVQQYEHLGPCLGSLVARIAASRYGSKPGPGENNQYKPPYESCKELEWV